jgi:preprotein translocase subunit SecG
LVVRRKNGRNLMSNFDEVVRRLESLDLDVSTAQAYFIESRRLIKRGKRSGVHCIQDAVSLIESKLIIAEKKHGDLALQIGDDYRSLVKNKEILQSLREDVDRLKGLLQKISREDVKSLEGRTYKRLFKSGRKAVGSVDQVYRLEAEAVLKSMTGILATMKMKIALLMTYFSKKDNTEKRREIEEPYTAAKNKLNTLRQSWRTRGDGKKVATKEDVLEVQRLASKNLKIQ